MLLLAVSIIARLGALHWLGDILALVVDYYIAVGLLLLVAYLLARAWRWAALVGAILLLNGQLLLAYEPIGQAAPPVAERSLRLMVYNIYFENMDLAAISATVARYDPDIVFLMEYSNAIQQQLEPAFAAYPHRLIQPSRMTMGLALFSRIPLDRTEVTRSPETRIPIYTVQMQVDGQPFTFVGGHPWPPQLQWAQLHRDQMRDITAVAERASGPLVVAGDFNAAPWSYAMNNLAERAEVRNIRRPLDITKSWLPLPIFGLPIDHVLVSDEWQVLDYRYGPQGGSDHSPLIIDLLLR